MNPQLNATQALKLRAHLKYSRYFMGMPLVGQRHASHAARCSSCPILQSGGVNSVAETFIYERAKVALLAAYPSTLFQSGHSFPWGTFWPKSLEGCSYPVLWTSA